MMADLQLKQGDTSPALEMQCQDNSGDPKDISGGSVDFHFKEQGATETVISTGATITNGTEGRVKYQWQPDDTNITPAIYEGEFEITYSDGYIETFPNTGNFTIEIVAEVA